MFVFFAFSLFVVVPDVAKASAPALTVAESVSNSATTNAATTSVTISGALAATATDHAISIDGVSIALGTSALTTAQVADKIVTLLTGGTDGAYTVATSSPSVVVFTRNAVGTAGNVSLTVGDASYTTTNEVKATRTVTVATAPASTSPATRFTIGTCVISFATTTAGVPSSDERNCNDNVATINLATTSGDVALTASQIATELRALTNVSDTGHGALTVGGSASTVSFTTTGTEATSTVVTASLSTGSSITLTTVNTPGVVLVTSSVPAVTFAGGLDAVAQVVTFTPENIVSNTRYRITINGSTYSYTLSGIATAKKIVEGLQTLVDADNAVSCSEDDTKVSCTAETAGTVFTYSTSVNILTSSGGRGGGSSYLHSVPVPTVPTLIVQDKTPAQLHATIQTLLAQVVALQAHRGVSNTDASVHTDTLYPGTSGPDVTKLQQFLTSHGQAIQAGVTGFFGAQTKAALQAWQTTNGIPATGNFGPVSAAKAATMGN